MNNRSLKAIVTGCILGLGIPHLMVYAITGKNPFKPNIITKEEQTHNEEVVQTADRIPKKEENNAANIQKEADYLPATGNIDTIADTTNSIPEENKILVGNVEVYEQQEGLNVQLIGKDTKHLEFNINGSITTSYEAKSLLFRMENDDYKVFIAEHDAAFFIGQRYDIKYNLFKEDQKISQKDLASIFVIGDMGNPLLKEDLSGYLDGVIREYKMRKRNE